MKKMASDLIQSIL